MWLPSFFVSKFKTKYPTAMNKIYYLCKKRKYMQANAVCETVGLQDC